MKILRDFLFILREKMEENNKNSYSEYFSFGADEEHIAKCFSLVLEFYRNILPMVKKDVTISTKYRDDELKYYVSVVLLEPHDAVIGDTGGVAFELTYGSGATIGEALEDLIERTDLSVKFYKTDKIILEKKVKKYA